MKGEKELVKINGNEVDAAGRSLKAYLQEAGYNMQRIAVERNEAIVPKSQYEETILEEGDSVEVVSFVGGG